MPLHQTQNRINSEIFKQMRMGSLCNPRGGAVKRYQQSLGCFRRCRTYWSAVVPTMGPYGVRNVRNERYAFKFT